MCGVLIWMLPSGPWLEVSGRRRRSFCTNNRHVGLRPFGQVAQLDGLFLHRRQVQVVQFTMCGWPSSSRYSNKSWPVGRTPEAELDVAAIDPRVAVVQCGRAIRLVLARILVVSNVAEPPLAAPLRDRLAQAFTPVMLTVLHDLHWEVSLAKSNFSMANPYKSTSF